MAPSPPPTDLSNRRSSQTSSTNAKLASTRVRGPAPGNWKIGP